MDTPQHDDEKLVTHADLPVLRDIDAAIRGHDVDAGAVVALLDRLITAAEADQPPLPEGWALRTTPDGEARDVVWHLGGHLYRFDDATGALGKVERDRLAPLRPTVTEADVEKAARVAWNAMARHATWEALAHGEQAALIRTQRAVFGAAGIEVQA